MGRAINDIYYIEADHHLNLRIIFQNGNQSLTEGDSLKAY
jgi:hypothetical protein